MISILIATKSFNDIKEIIADMATYNQFKIAYIASNCNEIYNKIIELKPDLVIVSMEILGSNSYQIVNKIKKISNHIKFIILNIDNLEIYQKLKKQIDIIGYIYSNNLKNLPTIICKNFIDSNSLEKYIMNELIYIGYNPSHKGTIFLLEIIKKLIEKNEIEDYCLKRDLYPILAKKYNKNIDLIKVDIFKATDNMYYNCDNKKLYEYFKIDSKPNLKEIIYRISANVLEKY